MVPILVNPDNASEPDSFLIIGIGDLRPDSFLIIGIEDLLLASFFIIPGTLAL